MCSNRDSSVNASHGNKCSEGEAPNVENLSDKMMPCQWPKHSQVCSVIRYNWETITSQLFNCSEMILETFNGQDIDGLGHYN